MTNNENENGLFKGMWRDSKRVKMVVSRSGKDGGFKHTKVASAVEGMSKANELNAAGEDVYFACALYETNENRKQENVVGAHGFWGDVDCGEGKADEGKGYFDIEQAMVALKKFCEEARLPIPNYIVNSGSGIHIYWVLNYLVLREKWQEVARKLKALMAKLGFLVDPSRTTDIASVLRVPGTLNHKYVPPKPVVMLKCNDQLIGIAVFIEAVEAAHIRFIDTKPSVTSAPTAGVSMSMASSLDAKYKKLTIVQLKALVMPLDANMGRDKWIMILMAVWRETSGHFEGFELIDAWSAPGKTYPGRDALMVQWKSFRAMDKSYTAGTLIKMAKETGVDVAAILHPDAGFEKCETVVVESTGAKPTAAKPTVTAPTVLPVNSNIDLSLLHPLGRYSASRDLEALKKNMVDERPLLGQIALLGQATVEFAQANTGKTLINIYLLIEAIKSGRIDPSKVFYINMDDNSSGLFIKCRLAQEYGFAMLADGHQGFQAKSFRTALLDMIESDTAWGVVVILDTLKKFVNTMDKVSSSGFAAVVRQFCLKGGTVIALAHTNKNPGPSGKPVYSGTTDIVDDFDCAYTLATVQHDPDLGRKLVEFENIKRRGNVALNVAYSYAAEPEISYDELVLSVQEVDPQKLAPIKEAAKAQSDAKVIAAVKASVQQGVTTKMKLIEAVAKNISISKRDALKIIETYTGTDVQKHRWKYGVGARGAQIFELLPQPAESPQCEPRAAADDGPPPAPPQSVQDPF